MGQIQWDKEPIAGRFHREVVKGWDWVGKELKHSSWAVPLQKLPYLGKWLEVEKNLPNSDASGELITAADRESVERLLDTK